MKTSQNTDCKSCSSLSGRLWEVRYPGVSPLISLVFCFFVFCFAWVCACAFCLCKNLDLYQAALLNLGQTQMKHIWTTQTKLGKCTNIAKPDSQLVEKISHSREFEAFNGAKGLLGNLFPSGSTRPYESYAKCFRVANNLAIFNEWRSYKTHWKLAHFMEARMLF